MDTNLEHIYNIIIANWKQLIDVIVKQPNYIPENDYIDRLITDTLDFQLDVSINQQSKIFRENYNETRDQILHFFFE